MIVRIDTGRPADPAQIILLTLAINYVQGVEDAFVKMQEGNANGPLAASCGAFTPSTRVRGRSDRVEGSSRDAVRTGSLKDQRPRLMDTSHMEGPAAPQHAATHFLRRLPLGQLPQSLLPGPDARVHDLQE